MDDKTNIQLTAVEMSSLQNQYINDTLACCVSTYFLEKVKDKEALPIIENALKIANSNLTNMQEIFKKERFPIPIGFADQDLNPQSPRLFQDSFVLMYFRQMSILAMAASSAALGLVHVRMLLTFKNVYLNEGVMMQDLTRELL